MSKRLILVLLLVAVGFIVLWLTRSKWREALLAWLNEPSSPFNLGIFRIVVFTLLLVTGNAETFRFYAALPSELVYPPELIGWVSLDSLRPLFEPALVVFQLSTVLAIFGAWTRWTGLASALTGVMVLGLPNWFGKVNHGHHLLWIAALLALSSSGHALGVDGIRAAFRRADHEDVGAPQPDRVFGVPLKMLVLILGMVYFFPGFYKLFTVGPRWMHPDAVRDLMYLDWNRMGHWLPAIRLDGSSALLALGAVGTVVFELVFLPLALYRRTRLMAAAGGLAFHNMTNLNLGIRFGTVQWLYVGFVDWKQLFLKFGSRLPRLYVLYDGECRFCRRAIASIRSVDLLEAFETIDFRKGEFPAALGTVPDIATLDRDIHAFDGRAWRTGADAFERVLRRVPVLWPLWPLVGMPLLRNAARAIYRRIADSRHLLIGDHPNKLDTLSSPELALRLGMALLAINVVFGVKRWVNSWPFACYPPYDHVAASRVQFLAFSDGDRVLDPMLDHELKRVFQANRLNGLAMQIRNDPDPAHQRASAQAFLDVWIRTSPGTAPSLAAIPVIAEEAIQPPEWGQREIVRRLDSR